VDSTTIAAAARSAAPALDLHAFTAFYERSPAESELALARAAAAALDLGLTAVVGDRHRALAAHESGATGAVPLDEPKLTDWRALVGAAAGHSSVVLYGEDGDSLFLPPEYGLLRRRQSRTSLACDVGRFVVTEHQLPYLGLRVRERLGLTKPPVSDAVPRWLSRAARALLADREPPDLFGQHQAQLPRHPFRPRTQQRLVAGVPGYLTTLMSPEVTRQRAELRCPLFDTRVIQLVMDVPAIPWCQRKQLPRDAYAGILPDEVVRRPKQGIA
jgi:asparagine synthetase B (glutamine-hydrolysing)